MTDADPASVVRDRTILGIVAAVAGGLRGVRLLVDRRP